MRVLISAYACEPGRGSEPGVGWNLVRHLSALDDLTVVTRANNEPQIREALATEPLPGVEWVFVDLPAWARWWKRGGRGVQLYYYLWQRMAYRQVRRQYGGATFDVAHHVTFVKFWSPSWMYRVARAFVWGPVGGGEDAPAAFRRRFSTRGQVYELLRDIARGLASLDPSLRATARHACRTFVTTMRTGARIEALGGHDIEQLWESGLTEDELARLDAPVRSEGPLRFVSMGRLLHLKGFDLGLEAFARARIADAEFWIVGDGPERARLELLSGDLGIAEKVRFLGAVPRAQALDALASCDVLVHPSLHDSGGWVCVEAMASRRPVICLDLGGPATQVTSECGFVVSADSPDASIDEMARAMREVGPADVREGMGQAARERAAEFLWSKRADFFHGVYMDVSSPRHGAES
jgi:glycosyltransferase involved in cell wall biosynthesis